MPATSATHNRVLFFFLLWPFTVLMKKTRAVKQSIFLDVYGLFTLLLFQKIETVLHSVAKL